MTRPEVLPGSTIGTYTVQGELGRTPWSETYVAAAPGDRLVALKIIEGAGIAAWEQLERTRTALGAVPGHLVLPIADLGTDAASGLQFVVTPLSDHPSLADLVGIYALSPSEAVILVKNLAIAIDRAHASGLLHLALKPSNVFVGPPPVYAVRIADFGSDAVRHGKKERGARMWLAPEQIDSEGPAGARADVFTMALLAFFAITGKPYWTASPDDAEALVREIRGPRIAPSERARALGAYLPPVLDADLLRALDASPEARFDSARALAESLERTLAEPPPPPERSSERHLKASQRLGRFRLQTPATPAAPLQTKTVKIPRQTLPQPQPPAPSPPPPFVGPPTPPGAFLPAAPVGQAPVPVHVPLPAPPALPPPPPPPPPARVEPEPRPAGLPASPLAILSRRVHVPRWAMIAAALVVWTLLVLNVAGIVRRIRRHRAARAPAPVVSVQPAPAPPVVSETAPAADPGGTMIVTAPALSSDVAPDAGRPERPATRRRAPKR